MRTHSRSPLGRGGLEGPPLETSAWPADVAFIRLSTGDVPLEFVEAPLTFRERQSVSVFGTKNNKTVRETIGHHRYVRLSELVHASYAHSWTLVWGSFSPP